MPPKKKKAKIEKEEVKQEEKNEESVDEEGGDEEDEVDSDADLLEAQTDEQMEFNFEAFPVEERDKEGIQNMLTQIFLRPDIETSSIADAVIAENPMGTVIGPADDEADEEDLETNSVFGLVTIIPLELNRQESPAFANTVQEYIMAKIGKIDNKEKAKLIEDKLKQSNVGLFINERMLQFPYQIVPPTFGCLRTELPKFKRNYDTIIYIHKIRKSGDSSEEGKKKKNKRKAAEASTSKTEAILYDNQEDEFITTLSAGKLDYVDVPVHMDVSASSKFHSTTLNDTKYLAYRRIAVMDRKRFDAFIKQTSESA